MLELKGAEQYTDAELIVKIAGGESRLYELLIRRYNPYLYRIGRAYRFDHHSTEDLMQETYVKAYYALSGFESRASFKTWISRIMLNTCYHAAQKKNFQNEKPGEYLTEQKNSAMFQQASSTEKNVLNKELKQVLEKAISSIPENYRLVFVLRELNAYSVAETAELAGLSESNVKVRLNRAKNLLRQEIEKMYSVEEVFEFNLVYCDSMVERVMQAINQ